MADATKTLVKYAATIYSRDRKSGIPESDRPIASIRGGRVRFIPAQSDFGLNLRATATTDAYFDR